ncbi:platelet-activating factor acetylhydrolase-like [Lycorma delicatula]|uniref:platelet-activating factor acetylhydrolase-like n=1 Tax=Lycorma delicatula TaxID=130591 RepID=UPI003F513B4B
MWWWIKRNGRRYLPLPEGPYVPGCVDIMTGYSKDGTFVRLYYPTSISKTSEDLTSKWFNWVPNEKYIEGFSNVVKIWIFLLKLTLWFFGGDVYVPAVWEGEPKKGSGKMPVIVFSHGFGACRFLCSTTLIELASRGFLIASVEHRDNSACVTYYYKSPEDRDNDIRTWIPHHNLKVGQHHYAIRNKQLKQRQEECVKVMNLLYEINEGKAENILKTSFNILDLKGCLDFSSACMMGHSFGAATSLYNLAEDHRFKVGVILDAWMFPLKEEKDLEVTQPLLFVNTQTFHIPSNLEAIKTYLKKPSESTARTLFTIKSTTHETQTDTAMVLGHWLDFFMKKLDPRIGAKINSFLILQFLHKSVGLPDDISQIEEYLSQQSEYIVNDMISYTKKPIRSLSVVP